MARIITDLNAALVGKTVGDELAVSIEAADAYGEYNEEKAQNALNFTIIHANGSLAVGSFLWHARQ